MTGPKHARRASQVIADEALDLDAAAKSAHAAAVAALRDAIACDMHLERMHLEWLESDAAKAQNDLRAAYFARIEIRQTLINAIQAVAGAVLRVDEAAAEMQREGPSTRDALSVDPQVSE
jgi:hypothetical protein